MCCVSESDLDSVHIVDFGNTVNYVHKEVSLYYNDFELQTPLYRAPEVGNVTLNCKLAQSIVFIVDFGNTVNYVHKEVSLYYNDFALQTRLYRAPEVGNVT